MHGDTSTVRSPPPPPPPPPKKEIFKYLQRNSQIMHPHVTVLRICKSKIDHHHTSKWLLHKLHSLEEELYSIYATEARRAATGRQGRRGTNTNSVQERAVIRQHVTLHRADTVF